jgi:hypothetical protein
MEFLVFGMVPIVGAGSPNPSPRVATTSRQQLAVQSIKKQVFKPLQLHQ